jgi:hypothetical protein
VGVGVGVGDGTTVGTAVEVAVGVARGGGTAVDAAVADGTGVSLAPVGVRTGSPPLGASRPGTSARVLPPQAASATLSSTIAKASHRVERPIMTVRGARPLP